MFELHYPTENEIILIKSFEDQRSNPKSLQGEKMPKYVIERVVPGASKMTPAELKSMSQRSCNVLNEMGPQIQWIHSYVTDNKIYCIYLAANEEMVKEHARLGGFPANQVAQVKTIIDPTTSEE
jgi:hypothetical protein